MSLQVWLPLNGDLHNLGLSNYNLVIFRGSEVYNNNGKIGKCFYANGVNTIKILNIIPNFYNYTGYSLCAWFCIEELNTSHSGSAIISAGNWNNQVLNLSVSDWSSDHYTRLRISGTNWSNTYTYNFLKNIWYHVVVSSDGNKTYAYVNGVLLGDTALGFLPTNIEGTDMCIGGATYYAGMQFFGRINDVRIYDHCLSAKEVEEISKGLVLHYKLNEFNIPFAIWEKDYYSKTANLSTSLTYIYSIPSNTVYVTPGQLYTLVAQVRVNLPNIKFYFDTNCSDADGVYSGNDAAQTVQYNPGWINLNLNEWTTIWITTTIKSDAGNPYYHHGFLFKTSSGEVSTLCEILNIIIYLGNVKITPSKVNRNIIYDSSGYQNNGKIIGELSAITLTPKYNCAISMVDDSCARYILTPHLIGDLEQSITMSCWIYQTSATATSGGNSTSSLFIMGQDRDYQIYGFGLRSNNQNPYLYISASEASKSIGASVQLLNGWHHIVGTYNGTIVKLYCDGILKNSIALTGDINWSSDPYKFVIGKMSYGYANTTSYFPFRGYISDFRVYATALTEAQIKELYRTSMIVNGTSVTARDLE